MDDVTIDADGLVRTASILVTNVLNEDCIRLVMSVDLLNAEGELAGQMTIGGSEPLPAGEQKKYERAFCGQYRVCGASRGDRVRRNGSIVHRPYTFPSGNQLFCI